MEFIRVEDCCEILDSQRKPVIESERVPGMYPYYGANGIQGTINQYIFDDKLVLVAEDGGHFGSKTKPIAYLVNCKCWVNNHAHVLRAKKGFLAEYICYSLMFYKIEGYINGATRQKLTQAALRKLIIPKRSVEYQKAIVDRLDLVKCIIEKKENIINELDLLIKSRFVEMFGDLNHNPSYPVVNLKSLIIGSPSNGFFASKELYDKNGKVNLVGVKEVVGNLYTNIYDTPKLNIDDSTLKKYLIEYGDMLFCRSSLVKSGIAKASIVPKSNNKSYIFECHTIKIKLNQQLCIPEFMQVQSEQTYFRNQVIKNSKTATMTTISQQGIVDTKVLLPPVSIQEEFTKFLSQINKLKSDVQKSIDETQLLMDSLMQEYFG